MKKNQWGEAVHHQAANKDATPTARNLSSMFMNDQTKMKNSVLKHVGNMMKNAIDSGREHLGHASEATDGLPKSQRRRQLKKTMTKSGKSGDSTNTSSRSGGSGKSGKGLSGGKSGKGQESSDFSGKSDKGSGGMCNVTVTNLSYEQSFSEMFVMVHSKSLLDEDDGALFVFGESAHTDLADLAQKLDTRPLINEFDDRDGVLDVQTISYKNNQKFLDGGSEQTFEIESTRNYNRLTLAAGLPFANDGIVSLSGGLIFDGAVYYLELVDAGVEQNLQTCWSVAAESDDFPTLSDCADVESSLADENVNDFIGEGFVHIHRGFHSFGTAAADFTDLLPNECTSDQKDSDTGWAEWFINENYDDTDLLCATVRSDGSCNSFREDADLKKFVDDRDNENIFPEYQGVVFDLVRQSDDFEEFCGTIEDTNDFANRALVTLEPELFDIRNPMAKVEIDCY